MEFPNGNDTILIEDPSYTYYINFLKYENMKVKTIKRDENGINLYKLEEIFKTQNIKFFYTIPRNHNPLGTYYSLNQRKAIMKLAHTYNVYIIEDDYFSDLSTLSRYSPLYYYSDFRNCIYLRSFSKTIPYIRIGVAIIPDDLINGFREWMRYSYYFSYYMPSLVSQATLESYIKSSIYNKHVTILSNNLKDTLKLFRKITSTWDSNLVKILGGSSGYYSTIRLAPHISCNKLLDNLKSKNIFLAHNSASYYNTENFDNSLRLSIARINSADLKLALNIIYDEILKLSQIQ
jgi:Transcriptional regulators containing a DNA-binding HTH domain and an aminotransferase domain (MocR family) and their eukaryotic orthologs